MRREEELHADKRNSAMRIFQALSSVDEELLVRSEAEQKVIPFRKYTKVMAACVCFLILGVATFAGTRLMSSDNATCDSAAPEEAYMAADFDGNAQSADEDMLDEYAAACDSETEMESATAEDAVAEVVPTEQENTEEGSSGAASAEQAENEELKETIGKNDGITWDMDVIDSAYERLDEESLRATKMLSDYIPTAIPEGYEFVDGNRYNAEEGPESVSLTWYQGMDYISVNVMEYMEEEELETRLADVSKPETYDVHLYEIPYASSVPDEVRTTFDNPIFAESDFTIDVIKARMKSVSEQGDTDTPKGNFAVLYESGVVVSFSGCGDAEMIWNMFQSIEAE